MDNLALFLRAFISKKLSTDPGWQGIHVILSDGSVPPTLTMAHYGHATLTAGTRFYGTAVAVALLTRALLTTYYVGAGRGRA